MEALRERECWRERVCAGETSRGLEREWWRDRERELQRERERESGDR
jgi:hypothetical protein